MTADFREGYKDIAIIPFKPEHLMAIDIQSAQLEEYFNLPEGFANIVCINGLSFTIINSQNEIVGVYGVLPTIDGLLGESWAFNSVHFPNHAIEVTSCVKGFFNQICSEGIFKVVRGCVETSFVAGHKWMRALKFKEVGTRQINDILYHIYERLN